MISRIEGSRLIFGSGMFFHQLLTATLTGLAFSLLLLALFMYFLNIPILNQTFNLLFRLFSIQFSIAAISGITLHTGSSENWPGVQVALLKLINHPFGRSAAIGFLVASACLLILYLREGKLSTKWLILISSIMLISTWIMSAWAMVINSWMQTPSGVELTLKDGHVIDANISNLYALIFNPSMAFRMIHQQIASLISGLIFLLYVFAIVFKKNHSVYMVSKSAFLLTGSLLFLLLILQPVIGHLQFVVLSKKQPTKAAAIESYYHTNDGFHIYIFGATNSEKMQIIGIHLPNEIEKKCLTTIMPLQALESISADDRPPVDKVFYSFKLMVYSWLVLVISLCGILYSTWKNMIQWQHLDTILIILLSLSVFAALSGWIVSESGRQPWIIYGMVKTKAVAVTCMTSMMPPIVRADNRLI